MASIHQDLRYAIRRLKETPGFTIAAIVTLALGLGLNSAVLSVAYSIFLKPLPLSDSSRLALVDETHAGSPTTFAYTLSYPDYLYYRDHTRTFAGLAAHYATSPMHISLPDGGLNLMGSVVTANYFSVLRLKPAFGRFFTDDEDRDPGRSSVAVLGHDLWRSRFGADPAVIGTVVRINGTNFTVVGIAPENFRGILRGIPPVEAWIPVSMFRVGYRYCDGFARDCRVVGLVGRLADGTNIEDAQSEMTVLARQLETAFPETNRNRGVVVRPARGVRVDEQTRNQTIVALMAAAAAVSGLVRKVLAFGPCLPSKFRLEVEMQYLPAGILSSFIPRQAEHPGWRSMNPASSNILSIPSWCACFSTCLLPGTIQTSTSFAFFFPLTKDATSLRSSMRLLVQLPIKT